jgi:hypothetical protein
MECHFPPFKKYRFQITNIAFPASDGEKYDGINRNIDSFSSPIPTLPVAGSRISHIFAQSIDSIFP